MECYQALSNSLTLRDLSYLHTHTRTQAQALLSTSNCDAHRMFS